MFPLFPLNFIVSVLLVTLVTIVLRWFGRCRKEVRENDELDSVEL
jgi:hypothetical protein